MPDKTTLVESAVLIYAEAYKAHAQTLAHTYSDRCVLNTLELNHFLETDTSDIASNSHLIVLLDDNTFPAIVTKAIAQNFSIGILPTPDNRQLCKLFAIPETIDDAMLLAMSANHTALDQLTCNAIPVVYGLNIGNIPFSSITQNDPDPSFAKRLRILLYNLKNLVFLIPHPVTLVTAKEEKIKCVVTGISVIEHDVTRLSQRLSENILSTQDGKLTALLVAPDSILAYLGLLLRSFSIGQSNRLPAHIGMIKSETLYVESNTPLDAWIDGRHLNDSHYELLLHKRKLLLNTSKTYQSANISEVAEKDTLKLDNIPKDEGYHSRLKNSLPFFSHAGEESFQNLFTQLRQNAALRLSYIILMILSSVIASFGLLQNSASVVIGAMILAPMMGPIVSFSMGLLRNDESLTILSFKSINTGIIVALAVSALIAALMPAERLTPEIIARTAPNLLDFGIAVFAGIAAAYAQSKEQVAEALPGVAIAVALVPPLCVSGIGLGWWNMLVFENALLLFMTNLAGITLAALFTFLIMGYSPLSRATRGITITTVLSVAVAIPLFWAFSHMMTIIKVEQTLEKKVYTLLGQPARLESIVARKENGELYIRAEIVSTSSLSTEALRQLIEIIEHDLNSKVIMNIQQRVEIGTKK